MRNGMLGSMLAMVAATVAVAVFLTGPVEMAGQAPKGKAPAKGGKGGGRGGPKGPPPGPVPRTADGRPDMSGFWGGVQPSGVFVVEGKGRGGTQLIVSPADAQLPYTPAARAISDDIIANRMFLEPELHCYMSGVPHNMWVQFGMQMLQTDDYLLMMWEFQHSRRIIPLDGRPHQLPDTVRLFQGESVGHWEGDTLVIETTNQTDRTWFDTTGRFTPYDMHTVERMTMLNSNQIRWEAEFTSESQFTEPVRMRGTISRANANNPDYEQMEFACIEGNRDLQHYTQDKGGPAAFKGARTK